MSARRYFAKRYSTAQSSDDESSDSDSFDESLEKVNEKVNSRLQLRSQPSTGSQGPNIKQRQKTYQNPGKSILESSTDEYIDPTESKGEPININNEEESSESKGKTETKGINKKEEESDSDSDESSTENSDVDTSESSEEELTISHAFVHKSKRRSNKNIVMEKSSPSKKQQLKSVEDLQKEEPNSLKSRALKYIESQHKKDIEIKLASERQRQFMQEDIGNVDDTDDLNPELEKSQWVERELVRQRDLKQARLEKAQSVIDRQNIDLHNV